MRYDLDDTICGIASPSGNGARGIVRASGPAVRRIVESRLWIGDEPPSQPTLESADSSVARLLDDCPQARSLAGFWLIADSFQRPAAVPVDVLYWPNARSFTRQSLMEIHLPGSAPLISLVLSSICDAGARLARPGEFTLRAFLGGRIDLTQAEAVLGVIDAPTDRELQTALDQLAGGLGGRLRRLRDAILDLLAHLEAGLDFAEEDIEFIRPSEMAAQLATIAAELREMAEWMPRRADHRSDPLVVLVGKPNAGKSSLFNALAHGSAIVSDTAGTTRDYLAATVCDEGVRYCVVDTAGLDDKPAGEGARSTQLAGESSPADAAVVVEAQRRTESLAREADLVVKCIDATAQAGEHLGQMAAPDSEVERTITVWTKTDLVAARPQPPARLDLTTTNAAPGSPVVEPLKTSARTGLGIERLRREIAGRVGYAAMDEGRVVPATASRCRESLHLAIAAIERAQRLSEHSRGEELIAAELRGALGSLGETIGDTFTDDILDRIFSRFCIGK